MHTGLKRGVSTFLSVAAIVWALSPAIASSEFYKIEYKLPLGTIIVNSNSILQAKSPGKSEQARDLRSAFRLYVTAYSSSEDETDSTPDTTASGTKTRDGIIASNIFPMGAKIKIPALFGEKIFVVEDRMHSRFTDRIDVWMPSKWQATTFGKKQTEVEVLEL